MLKLLLLLVFCCNAALGLFCYNCSATHQDESPCVGDFTVPGRPFNTSGKFVVNCTGGENAMCFVRSWRAREKHAWIVQRGCYTSSDAAKDSLRKQTTTPVRAMNCKLQRLCQAEYKLCLCQENWCNAASLTRKLNYYIYFLSVLYVLYYIF